MNMFRFIKSLMLASLFAVFVFALTGCGGPAKVALTDSEKSPEGVSIEDYLPQDTLMMISISTQDKDQREAFQTIINYFPEEDMQNAWKSMVKEFGPKLEKTGISYENDIAPIFGNSYRFTFGMTGDIKKDDPDMYIALTLADSEKAKSLLEKLIEKDNDLTSEELFGAMTLDNKSEDMYLALYKDTILITNVAENRESALKRMVKNEESILSNEDFKKSYNKLPKPNLGIAFINIKELFSKFGESDKDNMANSPFADALHGEAFAFTAEEDGIRVIVQVIFNKDSKEFNLNNYPYEEPYMYKNIPGGKLIMYSESYGMKDAFDIQMQALGGDKESQKEFSEFKRIIKSTVKLDFDEDILSWMDKGFALVLQHNKSIVPAISLYVDASSNTKSAQKVLDLIDAGVSQAVESMLANAPENIDAENVVRKDKVTLGKSEINRVALDFTSLSDEELLDAGLPSGIFVEPIEFYYGLTDENYFLISTYTGLDKDYDNTITVAENEKVKEAQTYLDGYKYQLSYISVDEIVKYVDTFVGYMEVVDGPIDENARKKLDKVKSYLAPIKYLVGSNKKEENVVEGLMFVKMEQPEI